MKRVRFRVRFGGRLLLVRKVRTDNQTISSPPTDQNSKYLTSLLRSSCFAPPATPVKKGEIFKFRVQILTSSRSHVFVGCLKPPHNLSTYIGGDSSGWGCIGTGALWHNRSKVRENFNPTWTEGDSVICTIDRVKNVMSYEVVKKTGRVKGGKVDVCGECEGLKPAVGLYQKDDKVRVMEEKEGEKTKHTTTTN